MTAPELATELSGIRALVLDVSNAALGHFGNVLDVDDTILDTRRAMLEAGTAAMAAVWPELAADHLAMAERYYADPARWFARYASGEVEFTAMRAGRLEEVAAAFSLTLPEDGRTGFETAYAPAFRAALGG